MVAVLACLPALWNGYAIDDARILANPALASAATLPRALASAWWYDVGHLYRPLTLFTLGAERLMAGPWLSHALNLVLHGLVALLVTRVSARFLPTAFAVIAGLAFALLPVHAEAVSSVVGRAELLCALSIVGALALSTGPRPPDRRMRVVMVLAGATALASKETGIVLPLIVFAAAWTIPEQRPSARTWGLASAAGVAMLLLARFAALGALGGDWAHPAFRGQPFSTQLALALSMLPRALAMLVLPVPPAIDYSPPLQSILHPSAALVIGGIAVVLALTLGIGRHRTRPQLWTLGVIIAAAAWLPSSNLLFPSGVVLSGRTLYTPSIGAALALGWAGWWAATRWRRPVVLALIGVLLGASAAMISRESRVWRDSDSVLRTMATRQPDDYRVPMYAGYAARDAGRFGESVAHFREAIGLFPRDPEVLTDAATVALQAGDTTVAVSWLGKALSANASAIRARTRLAGVLVARGDVAGARALLEEGLRLVPSEPTWTSLLLRLGPPIPISQAVIPPQRLTRLARRAYARRRHDPGRAILVRAETRARLSSARARVSNFAEEGAIMAVATQVRKWTLEEVHRLPEDGNKYELVRGALFVTPPPGDEHETILAKLSEILTPYVRGQRLGHVFHPKSVMRFEGSEVEPDLMVRQAHPDRRRSDSDWDRAPIPVLVVEVLSGYTRRRDLNQKKDLYMSAGVAEYWVVDPEQQAITVITSESRRVERERLTWSPLGAEQPLTFEVAEIF